MYYEYNFANVLDHLTDAKGDVITRMLTNFHGLEDDEDWYLASRVLTDSITGKSTTVMVFNDKPDPHSENIRADGYFSVGITKVLEGGFSDALAACIENAVPSLKDYVYNYQEGALAGYTIWSIGINRDGDFNDSCYGSVIQLAKENIRRAFEIAGGRIASLLLPEDYYTIPYYKDQGFVECFSWLGYVLLVSDIGTWKPFGFPIKELN